jgi:hypothetical protein
MSSDILFSSLNFSNYILNNSLGNFVKFILKFKNKRKIQKSNCRKMQLIKNFCREMIKLEQGKWIYKKDSIFWRKKIFNNK